MQMQEYKKIVRYLKIFFYNMLKVKEKNHINAEGLYHDAYSKSGAKNKWQTQDKSKDYIRAKN